MPRDYIALDGIKFYNKKGELQTYERGQTVPGAKVNHLVGFFIMNSHYG